MTVTGKTMNGTYPCKPIRSISFVIKLSSRRYFLTCTRYVPKITKMLFEMFDFFKKIQNFEGPNRPSLVKFN